MSDPKKTIGNQPLPLTIMTIRKYPPKTKPSSREQQVGIVVTEFHPVKVESRVPFRQEIRANSHNALSMPSTRIQCNWRTDLVVFIVDRMNLSKRLFILCFLVNLYLHNILNL